MSSLPSGQAATLRMVQFLPTVCAAIPNSMSMALMWLLSFSYSATANCIRGLNSKSSTVVANVLPFWSKPFPRLAILHYVCAKLHKRNYIRKFCQLSKYFAENIFSLFPWRLGQLTVSL